MSRLPDPPADAIGFERVLALDAGLRDLFTAYLDHHITIENSLDRVDEHHTADMQRGKVAFLRTLKQRVKALEHQGDVHGLIRKQTTGT
jgi:hypothetical protein